MIYVKMKWPACHERGTKKKSESPELKESEAIS